MVLGIGEGKITVTLEKSIYSPGETVRGKAILQLSQPKKARAIRLEVFHYARSGKHREKVVAVRKDLFGEKTYGSGESYDFEFLVPGPSSGQQLPQGLGALEGVIKFAVNSMYQPPKYNVQVSLDSQMEFDINGQTEMQVKRVQVLQ